MPFHPEPSAQAPWTRTIFRMRCSWFCAESTPQVNSNRMKKTRDIPLATRIRFIELLIFVAPFLRIALTDSSSGKYSVGDSDIKAETSVSGRIFFELGLKLRRFKA